MSTKSHVILIPSLIAVLLGTLFMGIAGASYISTLPPSSVGTTTATTTITSSVTSTLFSTTNLQTSSSTTTMVYQTSSTITSSSTSGVQNKIAQTITSTTSGGGTSTVTSTSSSSASSCAICQIVTFHIQDSATTNPIRGAQIGVRIGTSPDSSTPPPPGTTYVLTGITDSSGNVAFTLQAGASYAIVVTAVGWAQLSQNINAVANVTLSMNPVSLVTTTSVAGYRAITTDKSAYNLGDTVNFKVVGFTPGDLTMQLTEIDPATGTAYTNSNLPNARGVFIPTFDGSFTGSFVASQGALVFYGGGCCLHGLTLVVYSFNDFIHLYEDPCHCNSDLGTFLAWAATQPKTSFTVNWIPCNNGLNVACPPPQSVLGLSSIGFSPFTYGSFSFTTMMAVIGAILFVGGFAGIFMRRRI